jgi:predicted DNA-binding protein with PD1-like motif
MKKVFSGKGLGRVIVLNLKRGDLLLESIRDHLKEEGVKNAALVSIVGSLKKLVYHRPLNFAMSAEDEFITVEEPMEIGSLMGSVINGQPHFHIVASDLEKTHVGHLEEGTTVLYLAEIVLCEIEGLNIERLMDEHKTAYFSEIK